jgi:hypothetical protein
VSKPLSRPSVEGCHCSHFLVIRAVQRRSSAVEHPLIGLSARARLGTADYGSPALLRDFWSRRRHFDETLLSQVRHGHPIEQGIALLAAGEGTQDTLVRPAQVRLVGFHRSLHGQLR